MYIHELTTFITVADKGSFLKAATALYITPASVMNQINKLEGMIGIKLVERTNQGTRLTLAGQSIYNDSKKIIEYTDMAIQKAKKIADSEKLHVQVGTSILRPCKVLIDIWDSIDNGSLPFQIEIVPFDDSPFVLENILSSIGKNVDCFVSPCDSTEWKEKYNIHLLGYLPCRMAVPRKHRLANKKLLTWADLDGETIMLMKYGDSSVLNQMRDEIVSKHKKVKVVDTPNRYDTSIFNECEKMNYLMETLDVWKDIHPSILTIPMQWDYQIPYGIVYSKRPSQSFKKFIDLIQKPINSNML